jgi:hypothetical protein
VALVDALGLALIEPELVALLGEAPIELDEPLVDGLVVWATAMPPRASAATAPAMVTAFMRKSP